MHNDTLPPLGGGWVGASELCTKISTCTLRRFPLEGEVRFGAKGNSNMLSKTFITARYSSAFYRLTTFEIFKILNIIIKKSEKNNLTKTELQLFENQSAIFWLTTFDNKYFRFLRGIRDSSFFTLSSSLNMFHVEHSVIFWTNFAHFLKNYSPPAPLYLIERGEIQNACNMVGIDFPPLCRQRGGRG
jgi:hypothetical protein